MQKTNVSKIRAAVIQAGSVLMDQQASLEKAEQLIREAAKEKARLIVFPEAFLPGYPRGLGFGTVVGSRSKSGRELFARYHASAVEIPSEATTRLSKAAKATGVYLAMGIVERDADFSKGTL
ncbi:MAG: nitrilase-related carbon-nitrogen hydrolase, partial [bacterium]